MKIRIGSKVAAATLVEVVISLVIILAVFTVSMVIFAKVVTAGFSLKTERVNGEMESIISQSVMVSDFEDKEIVIEGTTYQKSVTNYPDAAELVIIHVQATEGELTVGSLKRLVRKL